MTTAALMKKTFNCSCLLAVLEVQSIMAVDMVACRYMVLVAYILQATGSRLTVIQSKA